MKIGLVITRFGLSLQSGNAVGFKPAAQFLAIHFFGKDKTKGTWADRQSSSSAHFPPELFESPRSEAPDSQETIAQLHQKIGQLTVEADWFKKKCKQLGL